MRPVNQITLRGLDPKLERELRAVAKREGISLNKAALRLLAKGAGVAVNTEADRIGHTLDRWIGTWSKEEAERTLASIQSLAEIDQELWK